MDPRNRRKNKRMTRSNFLIFFLSQLLPSMMIYPTLLRGLIGCMPLPLFASYSAVILVIPS